MATNERRRNKAHAKVSVFFYILFNFFHVTPNVRVTPNARVTPNVRTLNEIEVHRTLRLPQSQEDLGSNRFSVVQIIISFSPISPVRSTVIILLMCSYLLFLL